MSTQPSTPAVGVVNAGVLDLVTHDPASDRVILVMIETRKWDGGESQLFQVQEKINSYLSFALDGEMVETYPQFAGKRVGLQLDCPEYPTEPVVEFLEKIHRELEVEGIEFTLRVKEGMPSASPDACGSPSCDCRSGAKD